MTHSWHKIAVAVTLSVAIVVIPLASSGAQSAIPRVSLFGGINARSHDSPFAGGLNSLNVGVAADFHLLPFTIRLTGEFDQVPRGGVSHNVISGAADLLSPSVGLFRGARLYAFAGPGLYRNNGYKQGVPNDAGSLLLTVPTTTAFGFNAGLAVDFSHLFIQAKGVSVSGVASQTYFPVSIGIRF